LEARQGREHLSGGIHAQDDLREISDKFEKVVGKTLVENTGPIVELDAYRSIVGKIMYSATKIAPEIYNAVRELARRLSSSGAEHWKALENALLT
jgi:hypothetical protein